MSNLNIGQFLTNVFTAMQGANAQRTQAAPQAFEQMPPSGVQQNQLNTQMQNMFPNATAQLAQTASELAELNQKQTTEMMKELLNMPKNLEQLLSQLSVKTSSANLKTAMFLLTSTLDIMKLSAMLHNASKDATTNLYQMIANFNQMGLNLKDEQVSALSKMISVVASSSTSEVQSMKTMMLMYLPWLPLTDPDAFKLEFSMQSFFDVSGGEDSVTVMIATDNYGNVQGVISKTDSDGIKIEVSVSKTFPADLLKELIQQDARKYSININYMIESKDAFNKEKVKASKTKVFMNASPGINPFLVLISGDFIKHVHEIDTKGKLADKRQEMTG